MLSKNDRTSIVAEESNLNQQYSKVIEFRKSRGLPVADSLKEIIFHSNTVYDVISNEFRLGNIIHLVKGENTLSTLAISEILMERHSGILAKTKKILNRLKLYPINYEAVYINSVNRKFKCYVLPKEIALNVIGSYSPSIEQIISNQWNSLESTL